MSLSTLGLALNAVGALLLVFFPPVMRRYTKDGEPIVELSSSATHAGRLRARFQGSLSVSGFALLAIGFALQLYGEHGARHPWGGRVYLQCYFAGKETNPSERSFLLSNDGSQLTDAFSVSWRITLNTPIKLVAESPHTGFVGRPETYEELKLNRVSGSATWSRNEPVPPHAANDPDALVSIVEEMESGKCVPRSSRAIE